MKENSQWAQDLPSGRSPASERPAWIERGRKTIAWAQHAFYDRVMDVDVVGARNVPKTEGFLVAANHASHLDAGLVKYALGAPGARLTSIAAQDYFFASPLRRWYFENFTNLMPIRRKGTFKDTMRQANQALLGGAPLLVFPEGTRSVDGRMATFKPAIISLALAAKCPILPIYLWGTYEAMPKGGLLLPLARRIGASVGAPLPARIFAKLTDRWPRHEAYRIASWGVEQAVRALRERSPLTVGQVETLMADYGARRNRESDERIAPARRRLG